MKKLDRKQMAARVARDIPEGAYVNLGIGLPTLVADYLPKGREIILHSENGVLGMGPKPMAGEEDEDMINAGKEPVTLLTGGAFFHHADAFGMIRGRHLDFAVHALFAQDGHAWSCPARDEGRGYVGLGIEAGALDQAGIAGVASAFLFLGCAGRIVAQALHGQGGFGPEAAQNRALLGE